VQLGRWTVDLNDHVIYERRAPAQHVHLTPTEWQLLQALVRYPGRLVSQRQLLQEVWGPTFVDQTHYLRQYVKALRQKLEDDPTRPRHLITEPGMGYRFQPS
jgi:two-component system KDP operon response regulator KdpE